MALALSRLRVRPLWIGIALSLAVPPPVFALLMLRPELDIVLGSPTSHFYIVSLVAFLSTLLAVAVLWAARGLPDPRTFFLGMGFISMATIFLAHGLGTSPLFHQHIAPGDPAAAFSAYAVGGGGAALDATTLKVRIDATGRAVVTRREPTHDEITALERARVVGYSARLCLLASALFFALAVIDLPARLGHAILRFRHWLTGAVTAVLAGHVFFALELPSVLAWLPIEAPAVSWGIAGITWVALAFAGWRFFESYRLALLPLQGAMALGMAYLAEAQLFMVLGRVWQLSWWEYHVVMLAGFLLCVGALLRQYRITGDLGAIIEGLFLRQQVAGVRAGDPRALEALTAAISAKDSETDEHLSRVGELAVRVGIQLGLPEERMQVLRWGGRLHDIGKIGVPNAILRKPGRLTEPEFKVIQRHTIRGYHLTMRSGALASIAPIVRGHHEKMDGSGYPDGLVGEQIPLEARIVAVSDVWDAITWDRPYRVGMTYDAAAKVLIEWSGNHLDPRCVAALFAVLELDEAMHTQDGVEAA